MDAAMIVNEPFINPDDPTPAIARPPMKIGEEVATPQTRDPTSKIKRKARNVHFYEYQTSLFSGVGNVGVWILP